MTDVIETTGGNPDAITNVSPGGTGLGLTMSVVLINDMGTPADQSDDNKVHTVGENVLLVGAGWGNMSFDIPSQDATTPAGWIAGNGFGFGNGFAAGVDNVTICSAQAPSFWADLGNALTGVTGDPMLVGGGDLTAGTPATLELPNAAPNALTYVILSTATLNIPLLGGLLVPDPSAPGAIVRVFSTNGLGQLRLVRNSWPAGIPAGVTFTSQIWTVDAAGVAGFSASNAVSQTTP